MSSPTLTQTIGEFTAALRLHYGPGPHPDGSPQQVHGGGQLGFDLDAVAEPAWDAQAFVNSLRHSSGWTAASLEAELQACVPGATLRQIHDAYTVHDPVSGLTSKVSFMFQDTPGRFIITGDITNSAGADVGEFRRELSRETTGKRTELVAAHALFKIDAAEQGHGFGALFYQASERAYRQMGVAAVRLYANSDVGGYAWARMGFDWSQAHYRDVFAAAAETAWRAHAPGKYAPPMPKIEHAWEMAALTAPDGTRIGKEIMLGSHWTGYKSLTADSPGLRVGDAYYAQKAQKGKTTGAPNPP